MTRDSAPASSVTTASAFERYLAERAALVEAYMDDYLPPDSEPPETISRAVRYSLFAGGKRLRPILVLAAAEAVGGRLSDALPAAAALEMMHTYSLIHDDLPAMDNDSLRRGKPTSHVVFGDAIAILAGDALQTYAFEILAHPPAGCNVDTTIRLEAVRLLARAAGPQGMIGGQVVDLESEGKILDAATLETIHRNKTGALMRASAEIGALLGGASDEARARLARFGEELGLAFQIVDDILDVEGSDQSLGKSAGKDRAAGKATYPGLHGLAEAHAQAKRNTDRALALITTFGEAARPLVHLAERVARRRS